MALFPYRYPVLPVEIPRTASELVLNMNMPCIIPSKAIIKQLLYLVSNDLIDHLTKEK